MARISDALRDILIERMQERVKEEITKMAEEERDYTVGDKIVIRLNIKDLAFKDLVDIADVELRSEA